VTLGAKIVIAGPARSGTTALFYAIRASVAGPVRELFEARRFEPAPDDEGRTVLAKVLIGRPGYADYASFDAFDTEIGLVRDPRDWLLSVALHTVYGAPLVDEDRVRPVLDLLRRKESDPASASVRMLIDAVRTLHRPGEGLARGTIAEWCREHVDAVCDFFDARPGYLVVPYEDVVGGRVEALEASLGFYLRSPVPPNPRLERVARTRGAGDWRNWFTPEDVTFFRPLFAPFMERFGYPDAWDLPATRSVHPEHASGYVERLLTLRRAERAPG